MRSSIPTVLALATTVAGCWTDRAPARTTPRPTTAAPATTAPVDDTPDYRAVTIGLDVVGVAALAAGAIGLHRGANEDVSGALATSGMALAGFGTVITHIVMGRNDRALRSYLTRSIMVTTGSLAGAMAGCGDRGAELGCTFEGMLWGTAGGLAVAGALDALVLHRDEPSWTPTMSVTDEQTRVGIATQF
jgi:hypothetical protein